MNLSMRQQNIPGASHLLVEGKYILRKMQHAVKSSTAINNGNHRVK